MKADNLKFVLCAIAIGSVFCLNVPPASADDLITQQGEDQVLHLGPITVTGTPMVLKVLQMIKIGLDEPLATDPRMANVVVCRMHDETGSHFHQTLICATNKAWTGVRESTQTGMLNARANETNAGGANGPGTTSCVSNGCYGQAFMALNEALAALPGGYLHTSVDGSALRSALKDIPYPKIPGKPATPAPEATTQH
ncbi:MAG: hypothetical protein KGL98_11665 [Gammaproteobacteria bacterium]|nr:hypothetical protein [Gammaproteobacteria bacterium]MDE2461879.1 hypothetical protein [Gammaproteobacteria bacterium]